MYSLDIRKLACRLYEKFQSLRKTANILEISHTSISRWLHKLERKKYFRKSKICSEHVIETIKISLLINPFISTRKLIVKIKEVCQVDVSRELIRVAISKLGYTKKKAKFFSCPKNLPEKTTIFKNLRNQFINENRPFFSLDETSFGRHGKDMKGYSIKGTPLSIKKPQPRMTTVSSLVIMSNNEIIKHKEKEGSYNKESFLSFLSDLELPKKSVILLDNVRFHHCYDIKQYAKNKQWELLYIPPYSPWFNPIEGVFSIIKRKFYSTFDIDKSFRAVTQEHCNSFFKKSLEENT